MAVTPAPLGGKVDGADVNSNENVAQQGFALRSVHDEDELSSLQTDDEIREDPIICQSPMPSPEQRGRDFNSPPRTPSDHSYQEVVEANPSIARISCNRTRSPRLSTVQEGMDHVQPNSPQHKATQYSPCKRAESLITKPNDQKKYYSFFDQFDTPESPPTDKDWLELKEERLQMFPPTPPVDNKEQLPFEVGVAEPLEPILSSGNLDINPRLIAANEMIERNNTDRNNFESQVEAGNFMTPMRAPMRTPRQCRKRLSPDSSPDSTDESDSSEEAQPPDAAQRLGTTPLSDSISASGRRRNRQMRLYSFINPIPFHIAPNNLAESRSDSGDDGSTRLVEVINLSDNDPAANEPQQTQDNDDDPTDWIMEPSSPDTVSTVDTPARW